MPNPFADEAKYRSMVEHLRNAPPPTHPPTISADEDIAATIADIRKGRVGDLLDDKRLFKLLLSKAADPEAVVVDATALYLSNADKNEYVSLYDMPNVAPPWKNALICYQNHHGNILVMQTTAVETPGKMMWERQVPSDNGGLRYEADPKDDDEVDESKIRWTVESTIWLGGQGGDGRRGGVRGPLHIWRMAVNEDGSAADIGWVQLQPNYPLEYWDTALLVFLNTLNFMNCKNIELVDPKRTRPERRRIERLGVRTKVLSVFNVSRETSRQPVNSQAAGVPLTSVRGHFAHYGEKYGKKKLFGKIEGRFWIPQYARGDEQHGKIINVYKPQP